MAPPLTSSRSRGQTRRQEVRTTDLSSSTRESLLEDASEPAPRDVQELTRGRREQSRSAETERLIATHEVGVGRT